MSELYQLFVVHTSEVLHRELTSAKTPIVMRDSLIRAKDDLRFMLSSAAYRMDEVNALLANIERLLALPDNLLLREAIKLHAA